jgi:peptidoglycan hydrolase-like protein with peptidoglycan-binding domain
MKKLAIRGAVLSIFTAAVTVTIGIAGSGTAMACSVEHEHPRSDAFADRLPQVNYGDHGRYVLDLQLALRESGYKNLQGTGNYAGNTLAAVKDFQRKHAINDSGIVGTKTWHALVGSMALSKTHNGTLLLPQFGVSPGEVNSDKVAHLHNVLLRVYPYNTNGWLANAHEGDTYNPAMQRIVKDFQRRAGIKASGIVGPKTWAALYDAASASAGWGC